MKRFMLTIILVCACFGGLYGQENLRIVNDVLYLARAKEVFTREQVPSWVVDYPYELDLSPEGHFLLVTKQFHVEKETRVSRCIKHYPTTYDAQEESYLEFVIDPQYEKFVLHHLYLIRDGEVYDRLDSAEFELLQREYSLEEKHYTGSVHLITFINDLQAGDCIDCCYSIQGVDPLFQGHFCTCFSLEKSKRTKKLIIRYLVPEENAYQVKSFHTEAEPVVQAIGEGLEDWVWEIEHDREISDDCSIPIWYDTTPMVQISDFPDWKAYVDWAIDFYASPADYSDELLAQVKQWTESYPTDEERALVATRFVQRKIRYMAYCGGTGGLQPENPNVVFERGYGDCKGNTLLLCSLLRLMGIDASAALVRTTHGRQIEEWLPSQAFNHAIVMLNVGGTSYWVDPVDPYEIGPLTSSGCLSYGVGLIIHPDTVGLTPISNATVVPDCERQVHLELSSNTLDATLTVNTQAGGETAHFLNVVLQKDGESEFVERIQSSREDKYGPLASLTKTKIDQDEKTGVISVTEQYQLENLWTVEKKGKSRSFTYGAHQMLSRLNCHFDPGRTVPLALPYPLKINEEVLISGLHNKKFAPFRKQFTSDALSCTITAKPLNKTTYSFTCQFETHRDHVPVDQLADHHTLVNDIHDSLLHNFTLKSKKRR